jgi:hypothetical protein
LFPLRGAGRPQSDPDPLIKLKQHKIRILEGAVPKQEEEAPTPNGIQNQRLKKYINFGLFLWNGYATRSTQICFFSKKRKRSWREKKGIAGWLVLWIFTPVPTRQESPLSLLLLLFPKWSPSMATTLMIDDGNQVSRWKSKKNPPSSPV